MRVHERLAELLNVSTAYDFEGKTYKLEKATLEQRAEFSQFCIDAAEHHAETRRKRGGSQEAFEATMKGIAADVAAQKYEFEGEVCLAAMNQPAGQTMYLYIMLRDRYPEVTLEIARRMYEAKIQTVQKALEEVRSDPKALSGLADLLVGKMHSGGSQTVRNRQSRSKKLKTKRRSK